MVDSIANSYGRYNSNISQPTDNVVNNTQLVVINLPINPHIKKWPNEYKLRIAKKSPEWEIQGWTLVSHGQICILSPSRFPTALMAPSRAAPFPAWPDSPVIQFPFPSGYGSWHPSHVGARHLRPHTGTKRPLSPPQGVQFTIKTICDTGYAWLPTYPVCRSMQVYLNRTVDRIRSKSSILRISKDKMSWLYRLQENILH